MKLRLHASVSWTILAAVLATGCSSLSNLRSSVNGETSEDATDEKRVGQPQQKITLLRARASLAEMDKRPGDAMLAYRQILEIDSNDVSALHRLAVLQLSNEELDDAEKNFRRAIDLSPKSPTLQNDFGYFWYLLDRHDQAIEHFERALDAESDYRTAHNNLGLALAAKGDSKAAEHHFRLAKCGPAESLNNLAVARLMEADLEGAAIKYREALAIDPDHSKARRSLDAVNRITGRRIVAKAESALTNISVANDHDRQSGR